MTSTAKRLDIHASIPVPGDALESADVLSKLKPALDALKAAIESAGIQGANVHTKIVSVSTSRGPRKKKAAPDAAAPAQTHVARGARAAA